MREAIQKVLNFSTHIGELKSLERWRGQFFWRDYPQRDRYESVADHSWRVAMMLVVVEKYLSKPIDFRKAITMALIHDLPEMLVGDPSPLGSDGTGKDSHAYDQKAKDKKYEGEKVAAQKIFGELPDIHNRELYDLWLEFEQQDSYEAKVVMALDKIEPRLQVMEYSQGHVFKKHLDFNLTYRVETFNADPALAELGSQILERMKSEYKEFTK